jgi:predicted phage tail protein
MVRSSEVVLRGSPEENEVVRTFVVAGPKDAALLESQIKELEDQIQSPGTSDEDKAKSKMMIDKLKAEILALADMRAAKEAGNADTRVVADPADLKREAAELRAKLADATTSPEDRAKLKKELAERLAQIAEARDSEAVYVIGDEDQAVNGKLEAIRTERVSETTLDSLTPRLGVQIGDMITQEIAQRVRETIRQTLGEQFRALFHPTEDGGVELVIVGPQEQ